MGHQIDAYTASGERIPGPYFGRTFGFLVYGYFNGSAHNLGFSGDGEPFEVTTEQIWAELRKVRAKLADAERTRERYRSLLDTLVQCMSSEDRCLLFYEEKPDWSYRLYSHIDYLRASGNDPMELPKDRDPNSDKILIERRLATIRHRVALEVFQAVNVKGPGFPTAEDNVLRELADYLAKASGDWNSRMLWPALELLQDRLHYAEIDKGLLNEMYDFLKLCIAEGAVKIAFG